MKAHIEMRVLSLLWVMLSTEVDISASIRVLKSTLTLEEDGRAISGAKLVEDRLVDVADFSFCLRFNYKLLGGGEGRSQLVHIEDWRPEPKVDLLK